METIKNMPWYNNHRVVEKSILYSVKFDFIEPDFIVHTHWHDYIEFQIITAGRGIVYFNGTEYWVERGDTFILSHFDCHRVISFGEGLRITTINVAHEFLDNKTANFLNTSGGGVYCKISEEELEHINFECKKLKEDMNAKSQMVIHLSKIAISKITLSLLRKNTIPSGNIPRKIQKITAYINKNFDKDLSLESIAKEFETSANYLGKQFKNLLGITYNDYINRVRMRFACNLISSTDMSIKEIAHAAGYSSTEYFYSVFKKTIGVTPKIYRKERI